MVLAHIYCWLLCLKKRGFYLPPQLLRHMVRQYMPWRHMKKISIAANVQRTEFTINRKNYKYYDTFFTSYTIELDYIRLRKHVCNILYNIDVFYNIQASFPEYYTREKYIEDILRFAKKLHILYIKGITISKDGRVHLVWGEMVPQSLNQIKGV